MSETPSPGWPFGRGGPRRRRAVAAVGWVALLAVLSLASGPAKADDDPACTIPARLTKARPDPDGPATPVRVAMRLIDLGDIDEVKQEFIIDFMVLVRWQDPRLSVAERGSSLDECTVRHRDIWHPFLDIINQREIDAHYDDLVEVDADGSSPTSSASAAPWPPLSS